MSPKRIADLRAAGVLDGTQGDAARVALLDMVDICRTAAPHMGESPDIVLAGEILFYLDDLMRDTERGRALRWARSQVRRRARRRS